MESEIGDSGSCVQKDMRDGHVNEWKSVTDWMGRSWGLSIITQSPGIRSVPKNQLWG